MIHTWKLLKLSLDIGMKSDTYYYFPLNMLKLTIKGSIKEKISKNPNLLNALKAYCYTCNINYCFQSYILQSFVN
jgi:hypothetical protein